ncbi:MAG: hypothetical protein GXO74_11725 [Calditrichaeota bacterium]|nr:hypothetical protein [Calditrichota bacterium]
MKRSIFLMIIFVAIFLFHPRQAKCWDSFRLPTVVTGGSAGYFYVALDDFRAKYTTRWDKIYSGHFDVRVYRGIYLSVQYSRYLNENMKSGIKTVKTANWDERFINVGIRRYAEMVGRWNFYTGLGLTFISIDETPGLSVFENDTNGKTKGNGFYFEIGSHRTLLSHLGLFLEFEITSAGEGGTPGFVGHNIGGYAFQAGIDMNF